MTININLDCHMTNAPSSATTTGSWNGFLSWTPISLPL